MQYAKDDPRALIAAGAAFISRTLSKREILIMRLLTPVPSAYADLQDYAMVRTTPRLSCEHNGGIPRTYAGLLRHPTFQATIRQLDQAALASDLPEVQRAMRAWWAQVLGWRSLV